MTEKELAKELYMISQFDFEELDEEEIEVRLQLCDGSYNLLTGDPSYDTDHRGYWGCGSITPNMTMRECLELAGDLKDQCLDQKAEMES